MPNQDSDIKKHIIRDKTQKAFCTFAELGGTPIELQLVSKGKPFQIFDGYKTDMHQKANDKARNIYMIPFPNRVQDGVYTFEGKQHQLPINKKDENNAIHGFIWNRNFEIAENGDTATLSYDYFGDYPGFPFPFKMKLDYAITENTFTIITDILNTGKTAMPLGIGWHPYFTFHKPVDSLQLQVPAGNVLEADTRLIPTGNRKEYGQFQTLQTIGNTNFDTGIEVNGSGSITETKVYDPGTDTTITIQQDKTFKYVQVYIPSDRNSIAIEPMTCPANAFNSGEGLLSLKSNERFTGKILVAIS